MAKQKPFKNPPQRNAPVQENKQAKTPSRRDVSAFTKKTATAQNAQMPFDRQNYLLLAGCVGLITLGYALMRMDNDAYGFISLYISPVILLVGYLGVFYAIMKRPHLENETKSKDTSSESIV